MQLSAREVFTLLAVVERVQEELAVTAVHNQRLIELLTRKGILSLDDKHELDTAQIAHRDQARDAQSAERETKNPQATELMGSLADELVRLEVIGQPETFADTLDTDFAELLEKALVELRSEQGHTKED